MGHPILKSTAAALTALAALGAQAGGYLYTTQGDIVRNAYGECWHTSSWTPEKAVVGCDGKVAAAEPEPEPEPAPAEPELVVDSVLLDAKTFFDFDKAELRPQGRERLDGIIATFDDYEEIHGIEITGHADRIGSARYNAGLSARRAETVRDYLTAHGDLDPNLLVVRARGETEPVVACKGERGDALIRCLQPNRRVEVEISATTLVAPR